MNTYISNVFSSNEPLENSGKYFPINTTGHVSEMDLDFLGKFVALKALIYG